MSPDKSQSELLEQANFAYGVLTTLGPFYGKDQGCRPTFRVAAEPLTLPQAYKDEFTRIGEVILELSSVIEANAVPSQEDLHSATPISWRIDSIIDGQGGIMLNEINVPDGADALMTAEQKAYLLDPPYGISTPAAYVRYLDSRNKQQQQQQIAIIAESLDRSPYTANVRRMAELIEAEGNGMYGVTIIDRERAQLLSNWEEFSLVLNNGGYVSPSSLFQSGLPYEKLISAGSFSAIGSKAIFAAVHNENEATLQGLSQEARTYLQSVMPYTEVLDDFDSTAAALKSKAWVVKAYSAPDEYIKRLERGRAVVGPWSTIEEKLAIIKLYDLGIRFIKQEYIQPRKYDVCLRASGGRGLKIESRFNRICVKYVNITVNGRRPVPTAVEATLGSGVVPSGRDCCFLPVQFAEL